MVEEALTKDRILDTAEQVLRRFGPAKTSVVDVARALNVTHAAIYRYYDSKAALRDAVTRRWLERLFTPLEQAVASDEPSVVRLRQWLEKLIRAKKGSAEADPELFATYMALAADAREVIQEHVAHLIGQLSQIIRVGIASGEFAEIDPDRAAKAILIATTRFHHPAHFAEWQAEDYESSFNFVWELLLRGLLPRNQDSTPPLHSSPQDADKAASTKSRKTKTSP